MSKSLENSTKLGKPVKISSSGRKIKKNHKYFDTTETERDEVDSKKLKYDGTLLQKQNGAESEQSDESDGKLSYLMLINHYLTRISKKVLSFLRGFCVTCSLPEYSTIFIHYLRL